MAKIEFKGMEAYQLKLSQLSALDEERVIGSAVYDGAEIAADIIREEISALPTDESWGSPKWPKMGPSQEEKDGLLESFGITPIRSDNGFINVKLGFDGYQGKPTRRYPRGKPNQMIARSVASGTTFMFGHPFMKRGIRKAKKAAEAAMEHRVNEEINKIMK